MFRLGFIINPVAGIGGAVGLKGSDGVVAEALARGAVPKAQERARQALLPLCELSVPCRTADGGGRDGGDSSPISGIALSGPLSTGRGEHLGR